MAVTAGAPLERAGDAEFIQRGRDTFWVTEASTTRRESFEAFSARIRRSSATFDGNRLSYASGGKQLSASFETGCALDGAPLRTAYPRHESKYGRVDREPSAYWLGFGGHALALDLQPLTRNSDPGRVQGMLPERRE